MKIKSKDVQKHFFQNLTFASVIFEPCVSNTNGKFGSNTVEIFGEEYEYVIDKCYQLIILFHLVRIFKTYSNFNTSL